MSTDPYGERKGKRLGAQIRLGFLALFLIGAVTLTIDRAMSAAPIFAVAPLPVWLLWFWLLDGVAAIRVLRGR